MILFLWSFILFYELNFVNPVAIDNDVVGEPIIECGENSMTFSVKTRKLFAGRIFIKGKTAEATCMKSGFAQQQTSQPSFDLTFGACGMKGQRVEEPRGMYYSAVFIVSFHPIVVTKVDRSYHVKCFFEETLRTITAGIDVSMITTADVTAYRPSVGTCTYSIHQGTVSTGAGNVGPQVSVAQVGDKIVHKWDCTDGMYGVLVRNCYVTDGFGTQTEVIDKRGCPVDPVLISGISYDSTLTQAFAESHVFKFADRPGVWFYCQIQMCLKMSQACEGVTPPTCGMMPLAVASTQEPTSRPGRTAGTKFVATGATPIPSDATTPTASEGETESPNPPGITPPKLPPAPPWSSSPSGRTTTASSHTRTSGYSKELLLNKKRVFVQQEEDAKISVPTAPAIYEEEELIYDESGVRSSVDTQNIVSTPYANQTEIFLGKPPPAIGSNDRIISYRQHRRVTTTRAFVKRSAHNQGHETSDQSITKRSEGITRRLPRPVAQRRQSPTPGRTKEPKMEKTEDPLDNVDTFMYKDSELSNRLIIFDADEEPPPGLMHWSRKPEQDRTNFQTVPYATADQKGDSPKQAATQPLDICVISAQGLIMILIASGSFSALLMCILAVVCFRYRMTAVKAKSRRRASFDFEDVPKESAEIRMAKLNEKATRWQFQQQKVSDSSKADTELPRLPRSSHERRKHR